MHAHGMVASVLVGPRRLRERSGRAYLPFATDYRIELRNKTESRAQVRLLVDGREAAAGRLYVLAPGQRIHIEGFPDTGSRAAAFRFIERTERITRHRGAHASDATVRIEAWFGGEEDLLNGILEGLRRAPLVQIPPSPPRTPHTPWAPHSPPGVWPPMFVGSGLPGRTYGPGTIGTARPGTGPETLAAVRPPHPQPAGLTVPGPYRETPENPTSAGAPPATPPQASASLTLRGVWEDGTPVVAPLFTRTRTPCPTCGREARTHIRFCPECGTHLKSREARRRAVTA